MKFLPADSGSAFTVPIHLPKIFTHCVENLGEIVEFVEGQGESRRRENSKEAMEFLLKWWPKNTRFTYF